MTNLQSSITGNTLTLDFNSQAGWNCCYTAGIEIICAGGTFTGTANYFSQQICHSGQNTNVPYPSVDIDITNFCPGNYEWRVSECSFVFSAPATFTVPGIVAPFITTLTPQADTICTGESVQLNALGTGGCNNAVTYSWSPTTGLSNPSIPNPVATPLATTTYTVTITEINFCNLPGVPLSVEIVVLQGITSTTTAISDTCGNGVGTVVVTPTTGTGPYTYNWPTLGSNDSIVFGVPTGFHNVEVVDANGCEGFENLLVDNFQPIYDTDSTVVSCAGGSDGTATVTMIPSIGNVTYQWNDPNAQTTQTAVGLSAGNYICTVTTDYGCVENVVVGVTENLQLLGVISNIDDVTCHAGDDGSAEITASQGVGPYTYSWTNSPSVTNIANNLTVGNYVCTITDDVGCTIDVLVTIAEPDPLQITSITLPTSICPEDSILLQATGIGGSSPYTFTWFENGNLIGTGNPIWAQHNSTNTQYCVVLSEDCGSPTDEECTVINFHDPIVPSMNQVSICVEGIAQFQNLSSNAAEIATTYWDFGANDQSNATTIGADPTSYDYSDVGLYDVSMTITSVFGCVYTDTFVEIAEMYGNPTAYFTLTDNPTLVTNNVVTAVDGSSADVNYWEWTSVFSTPTTGNTPIIDFTFPYEAGTYPIQLYVETAEGCANTITLNLTIYEQAFFAPNSFTPDGDEFNQTWKPEMTGFDPFDYHLTIFNRWGEIIFESFDINVGWDGTVNGKLVQLGSYSWKVEVKNLYDDARSMHTGHLNLLK